MRQLLPTVIDDVDIVETYLSDTREPVGSRPWLAVNMATTIDGATAIDGRSGGIGGEGDHGAFHALRSAADVIIAGAGTVRAENYSPVKVPEAHLGLRRAAGRHTPARIAIVTASCDLDPGARLFSDTSRKPLIYTVTDAPRARVEALADIAEVVAVSAEVVDVRAVLDDLGRRSTRCVVCEGGPSLNGHLIEADLVDEWCWTIAPLMAGGTSARAAHGPPPQGPRAFTLDRLLTDGSDLLTRYVADR